jgi:hypothetical protein
MMTGPLYPGKDEDEEQHLTDRSSAFCLLSLFLYVTRPVKKLYKGGLGSLSR